MCGGGSISIEVSCYRACLRVVPPSLPQVLSLTSPITASYLTIPHSETTMIDVNVPSLHLTLSPATIRLVLHVVQKLTLEKVCECLCA